MVNKSILTAFLMTSLTACSMVPDRLKVETAPVERPIIVVPNVDEFKARDVEWITITPENVNNIFADLQESGQQIVLIATTPEGIQNLTLNMSDLLKLVQQQKVIIATYKEYYEANQP